MVDHFLPSTLVTVLSRFHSYKSRCGATRGPIAVRLLASCISNRCSNLASMTFVGSKARRRRSRSFLSNRVDLNYPVSYLPGKRQLTFCLNAPCKKWRSYGCHTRTQSTFRAILGALTPERFQH